MGIYSNKEYWLQDAQRRVQQAYISKNAGDTVYPPATAPGQPQQPAQPQKPAAAPKSTPYQRRISQHYNNIPYYMDHIKRSMQQAQTGGQADPFIRTRHRPKGGSTAFGPYQITKRLVQDMFARYPNYMAQHKKFYDTVLAPQYALFLKNGGQEGKPWYDPRYDYGGGGKGWSQQQRADYYNMANTILRIKYAEMQNRYNYRTPLQVLNGMLQVWNTQVTDAYRNRAVRYFNSVHKPQR